MKTLILTKNIKKHPETEIVILITSVNAESTGLSLKGVGES